MRDVETLDIEAMQRLHRRIIDSSAFTSSECDALQSVIDRARDALADRQRRASEPSRDDEIRDTLQRREEMLDELHLHKEVARETFEVFRAEHARLQSELRRKE